MPVCCTRGSGYVYTRRINKVWWRIHDGGERSNSPKDQALWDGRIALSNAAIARYVPRNIVKTISTLRERGVSPCGGASCQPNQRGAETGEVEVVVTMASCS